jgi:NAD(P)-dependent dehydrogenase (short-subunit alcohol dehydrogenase family)
MRAVLSEAGRIDVLVNNAGVAIAGALEETTIGEFRNVVDTNVFGAVRMMLAVLPVMREQRAGRIVNIGSVMAFLPMPYSAAYCASKHAIRGLSESVDHEVRGFGIRVVVIEPAFIRTDIVRHSPVAASIADYAVTREFAARKFEERLGEGEDPVVVARVVVEAATTANPKSRYLPDGLARVMSLARGILPSGMFDVAVRSYFRLD